jgi:hypothetical protein
VFFSKNYDNDDDNDDDDRPQPHGHIATQLHEKGQNVGLYRCSGPRYATKGKDEAGPQWREDVYIL